MQPHCIQHSFKPTTRAVSHPTSRRLSVFMAQLRTFSDLACLIPNFASSKNHLQTRMVPIRSFRSFEKWLGAERPVSVLDFSGVPALAQFFG